MCHNLLRNLLKNISLMQKQQARDREAQKNTPLHSNRQSLTPILTCLDKDNISINYVIKRTKFIYIIY